MLATEGLGPKALRALVLTAELIYGTKASARDPARFSFAHGGKDGTPFRSTAPPTIGPSRSCAMRSDRARKIDRSERIRALKRLAAFTCAPAPHADRTARTGGAPQSTYTP